MSREKHASLSGPPIRNSSGVVVKRDHKFFKTAGPAFTVAQPSAKFEFVDNTNPKKDIVVRRKAREWVHRDKDGKKCKEGPEDQNYPIKGQIIIHQEMCDLAQQSGHGILDVSTDRFDPFGVLPVPGTRKVDHIIEYFLTRCPDQVPYSDDRYASQSPSLALEPQRENTLWAIMSAEPVSFTIFLHATTLIRDGVQNNWRSKESLLYYSLALRAVKEALKRRVEEYSDSFVTALAGFAACANFAGNYEAAEIHRDAMVKAVRLKGGGNLWEGIRKFNHFTQRALTWCEFHVAAKGPSLPKLPYTPPNTISALPPALLIEANRLNTLALSEVPTLSSPLPQILFQLNQLSLSHFHMALSLSSFVWIGHGKVPGSVVRLLYDTEYNLLKILSAQRESTHTFSALDIVYTEACQLYLWISIRRMPLEMKMYDLFVTRLKSALVSILDQTLGPKGTRTESDTLSSCDSEVAVKSTITFLWPLFLGTFVSSVGSRPECSWFLEQFTKIVQKTSQIRTKEDLQDMLKIFPWTDRICRRGIADIAFLFE